MTQIATPSINPAVAQISDHLNAVGQKYRLQRLLRGLLLLALTVALATATAVVLAHLIGAGTGTQSILAGWCVVVGLATLWWFVRPLLFRPDPAAIAHLVESRLDGLHNGFTNALLLSTRTDLAGSPWLPQIYDEILRTAESRPLRSAVRLSDLRPLLLRVAAALVALAIVALLFRASFAHGWQQLFNPTSLVPQVGAARFISIEPGNSQLVVGKPLELTVIAHGPASLQQPALKVIFDRLPDDGELLPLPESADVLPATIEPLAGAQQAFRYVYKLDRLDRSLRYRVELAGTQSDWFSATIIREVKLLDLTLKITPPTYTRQASNTLRILAADIGKTPVVAAEGSQIEVIASIDVPVEGAVLQLGDATGMAEAGGTAAASNAVPPLPMTASQGNRQFAATFTLLRDTPIVILLTDARGQAMFRVPEGRFVIEAKKDAPPTIEMKWPAQDVTLPPVSPLQVRAIVRDDRGLSAGRVLVSIAPAANTGTEAPVPANDATDTLKPLATQSFPPGVTQGEIAATIDLPPTARVAGTVVRVQLEATDNRDLGPAAVEALKPDQPGKNIATLTGRQTSRSAVYQIRLQPPEQTSQQERQSADALRKLLEELLATQQKLHASSLSIKLQDRASFGTVAEGQATFRTRLKQIADTFVFQTDDRVVQKAILMLAIDPAKQAVEAAQLLRSEPAGDERRRMAGDLLASQRRIISTLESLLAVLNRSAEPTTQPTTKRAGDLASRPEELKKLDEALKAFIQQQQKLLDQTAPLAKKPADSFDDADKKLMEELTQAQEKLDAFMQEKVHDFSRAAAHDMSNTSTLQELMEVYSEVAMARDALKAQALEVAVAAEEMGLELAKVLTTNNERWLANNPDRIKWLQEDPLTKNEVPMAQLPKEMNDIIGELLEQEEDLFDELEDQNANWHDSIDKGIGWDATDGPISNMTARGVTGNQLPNNNEMSGRSGEGRSGKSQGEMVEETASGKGGRRTPTRLDPTAFQQGQIKDQSKDPTGGATGGGKVSGQGGQGLEGPVPPARQEQMQRLAQKQAQLRNAAERLNLQYQLGRYDNFKLLESIALMRRVEADLKANRYQTALRRKDVLLDRMDTSRLLVGAEVHVKQDTTPTGRNKQRKEVGDAMKGELPEAWKESLKRYYEKLAEE